MGFYSGWPAEMVYEKKKLPEYYTLCYFFSFRPSLKASPTRSVTL